MELYTKILWNSIFLEWKEKERQSVTHEKGSIREIPLIDLIRKKSFNVACKNLYWHYTQKGETQHNGQA